MVASKSAGRPMFVGAPQLTHRLEAAWTDALSGSLAYFRALLSSSTSSSWKPVQVLPLTASSTARDSGLSRAEGATIGKITAEEVVVHRRSGKGGDVYRAMVEVDCGPDVSVDTFRGCLVTPETRPRCEFGWTQSGVSSLRPGDRMVEEAVTLDLLDAHTRVTKSNYRLGWPSSPRDAITISKTLVDRYTLIDISTSLPRSKHEPAYLRPAPPYVRAQVSLLAWCVQLPGGSNSAESGPADGKARITCFWSWNPKGAWAVGGGVPQHLPSLMVGLVDYVREGSESVPLLLNYGPDLSVGSVGFDTARVTLTVSYAVVNMSLEGGNEGMRRQIEFGLSSTQSWDVQIQVRSQTGEETASTDWTPFVGQELASEHGPPAPKRLMLRFAHAPIRSGEELVRVNVSIERTSSSGSSVVRINGIPIAIETIRPPSVHRPILEEAASSSAISLRTFNTMETPSANENGPILDIKRSPSRSHAAEKSIASLIRRNYIYFTSLLQEPEGKWRPVLDSRGVAIHQLDSIDKTLIVFRAEAVFVGVGIWDLFATIASPGARVVWDKTHDDATLLEDVNELTNLWHFKSKAAWPTSARDSVMLRTTYKSPTSVHVFGFSVDNTELFPRIPPSTDPTTIRTQIDLQGWSIESLSPNTTQVTLVEQSDPRGWSNKSSIPQVMMSTLAGIGEFAIKHGAPPVTTRIGGARSLYSAYSVEKETYKFEYEAADARRSHSSSTSTAFPLPIAVKLTESDQSDAGSLRSLPGPKPPLNLECEIRCDADQWSNNIAILIDPPPTSISALKRHRLSHEGGGLWLTIEHDPAVLRDEKVTVTVRKGTATTGGKTAVSVNGSKVKVDVEDLHQADVKLRKNQKRARPSRAPLDQPPALGTLRKKQSTADLSLSTPAQDTALSTSPTTAYGRFAAPFSRWYNVAAEQTRAAIVPMATPATAASPGTTPVDAAIRALGQLTRMHADRDGESTDPFGWQPVSDTEGLKIEKRIVGHVSETFPVHRAGRIVEGYTAEEVSAAIRSFQGDERFEKPVRLESYGPSITTDHIAAHTTFPFRGRSMLVATIVAKLPESPPPSPSVSQPPGLSTILHASTSAFDPLTLEFSAEKYNPSAMPTGNVILEGWILETLDPYSHEQYAIPSTRCMYVGAVDYSGNMPLLVNNMLNASLPRSLLSVEAALKARGPPSRTRWPPMMLVAPEPSAQGQGPWAVDRMEEDKVGVDVRNDDTGLSTTIIIQPAPSNSSSRAEGGLSPLRSPSLHHTDSKLSVGSGRSTVIDLGEDIRRGRRDFVVAEIDVGAALAKAGCDVEILTVSLPAAQHSSATQTRGDGVLSFTLPPPSIDLPFKVSVIALTPSVLQSASLDPGSSRHLLRVILPTSGYEASVDDPLGGSARSTPSPRPRWLLDLINDGAVVQIRLKARTLMTNGTASSTNGTIASTSSAKNSSSTGYRYEGQDVSVEEEKHAKLQKEAPLPRLVPRSSLSASSSAGKSSTLDKPLAVATEYLAPRPVVEPANDSNIDSVTDAGGTLTPSESLEAPRPSTEEVKAPTVTPSPMRDNKRFSFWNYSRLGRFSVSEPASLDNSPKATKKPLPLPTASEEAKAEGKTKGDDASKETKKQLVKAKQKGTGRSVSLNVFILSCLVCLLVGSLLRSILSEADFVIYPSSRDAVINQGAGLGHGEWRELRRLGEWRIGWNRDLIVAIARRGE